MKIIQIINSLATGGAEKLLLETLPLYRQAGIEMDVLLLWDNNQPFTKTLKELNCSKVFVLNESENYKDIYSLSNILQLSRYLKGYDIAHVHLFPAQYYVVFANFLLGNTCKLIFTEHNTSNTRIQNKLFKPIENFIYRRYHKIICISEGVYKEFEIYLSKLRLRLLKIENGVPIQKITNSKAISRKLIHPLIASDDVIIVQVSAFRVQKDHETLIKAIANLPKKYKLVLVGDGDLRKKYEDFVKQLNIADKVFFLGLRNDVYNILKTCDVAVLSSHWEGFGLVAVEGMASSKPFLASNVPGLKDVVAGAGILFEQGNAEELASKIIELMNDPKLYSKVADACQQRAKQYDIQVMVEKHIQLYHEVYEN